LVIDFVFLDVGETLIDETRAWRGWAAYLTGILRPAC
jgi:hypothetical protein